MPRLVIALLVALAVTTAGCSKSVDPASEPKKVAVQAPAQKPVAASVQQTAPANDSFADAPTPSAEPQGIVTMTPSQKRKAIAESFPLEVPVPVGNVVQAEAQGQDAWDYEIVVDAKPAVLVKWFRDSYSGRSWKIVEEKKERGLSGADSVELDFRKSWAGSRVTISEQDGKAYAAVIVGVGAEVLQTQ